MVLRLFVGYSFSLTRYFLFYLRFFSILIINQYDYFMPLSCFFFGKVVYLQRLRGEILGTRMRFLLYPE